ncbi:hypothetical protein Tco_0898415 [Tanacetum coccineum]
MIFKRPMLQKFNMYVSTIRSLDDFLTGAGVVTFKSDYPCRDSNLAIAVEESFIKEITYEPTPWDTSKDQNVVINPEREPVKPLEWKALENILRPSIEEPPKVELKELPDHLQYAFLQEYQWNRLVILYLQNSHGRWFKPTVQPQRRVNPNIKEAVKKKVTKLLDTGPIYPISDSPWVASKFLLLQKFKRKPPLPVLMETSLIKECLLDYATPNHISALSSFDHCLANLEKMLKRCEETNLVLN